MGPVALNAVALDAVALDAAFRLFLSRTCKRYRLKFASGGTTQPGIPSGEARLGNLHGAFWSFAVGGRAMRWTT